MHIYLRILIRVSLVEIQLETRLLWKDERKFWHLYAATISFSSKVSSSPP